jgi:adenylate cyclase
LAEPIETKRRLAAIFAADVEGYSRLMGADEVATLDALTARREILDGLIATRGGRIANTAGDSVLAEFGSAVDAVRCAMEAQVALAQANTAFPETRHINFRMGSMLVTSWSAQATCLVTGSTSQRGCRRSQRLVGSASPV